MRMKKGTMLLLAIAVIASFLMIIALGGVEERLQALPLNP